MAEVENAKADQFIAAKGDLLSYYSSQQTSQSARLIGLAVVLLTLLQAINTHLSVFFLNLLPAVSGLEACAWVSDVLRFHFFLIALSILLALLIYTAARFSVFAQLSSEVIYVSLEEIRERKIEESLHCAIHCAAWKRFKKRNPTLLGVLKVTWFVTAGEDNQSGKGWICSILIGIVMALFLLWFLW